LWAHRLTAVEEEESFFSLRKGLVAEERMMSTFYHEIRRGIIF